MTEQDKISLNAKKNLLKTGRKKTQVCLEEQYSVLSHYLKENMQLSRFHIAKAEKSPLHNDESIQSLLIYLKMYHC